MPTLHSVEGKQTMSGVNLISFRFPFESQIAKLPPEVQMVHRTTWDAITDLQGAIPSLKSQITALQTSVSSSSASSAPVQETVVEETVIEGTQLGGVDNQTGATAYTLRQSDNGSLVILNDSSAIALTLIAVTIPFATLISNYGSGTVTITPQSGATINYGTTLGASSMPLASGAQTWLFYDGSTNWWA